MSPKSAAWLSSLATCALLIGAACLVRPPQEVFNQAVALGLLALLLATALLGVVAAVLGVVLFCLETLRFGVLAACGAFELLERGIQALRAKRSPAVSTT